MMGLAANPDLVPPSIWLEELFGELKFVSEAQAGLLESVLDVYNQQMAKVMDDDFKLPTQCKLPKTDPMSALAEGQPLPSWCLGMLQGLKLVDTKPLDRERKSALSVCKEMLKAFTSPHNAEKFAGPTTSDWQDFKRNLSLVIGDTIYALRFDNPLSASFCGVFDHDMDDEPDGAMSDLDYLHPPEPDELLLELALVEDSKQASEVRDQLIAEFEQQMGDSYMEENAGHFWMIQETRNYMMLRFRRGELNFAHGKQQDAIAELKELLVLNPNDNQGIRYPLANMLVICREWPCLDKLMADFGEESAMMLAPAALMAFAKEGDSANARKLKKALFKANKHFMPYLTGQKQPPKQPQDYYSPGDKSEAICYLNCHGKQAWRSVDGALFWLRKK